VTKSENQNKKNDSTSCDSCFDIYLLYSYWRYFCIYEWCSYACKEIALVVPALLSGVAITVLIQRIKEIKKGEDDDLSKY
jgi:hypothetical protein